MIRVLFLFFFLYSLLLFSQSNVDFIQKSNNNLNTKTSQKDANLLFQLANTEIHSFRKNPAFIHFFYQDSIFLKRKKKPVKLIFSRFTSNTINGDYLYYNGNYSVEKSIGGIGEKIIPNLGTVYGSLNYTKSERKNVYQNYVINPEKYAPYTVGDTLGVGDLNFEKYALKGGFSFKRNKMNYGVEANYDGIVQSKLTNPRLSVYNSLLKLKLGAIYTSENNLYSLAIVPEIDRQVIASDVSSEKSVGFLQFYGFGAWNRIESYKGKNYKGYYNTKGIGGRFGFKNKSYLLKPSFHINYKFRKMNFDVLDRNKSTIKNLFSSEYHNIYPEFTISYKRDLLSHFLVIKSDNVFLKGTENVFENSKVSSNQNLYDYIKVASKEFYTKTFSENWLLLKTKYQVSNKTYFNFILGTRYIYFSEEYNFPQNTLSSQNLVPNIGISIHKELERSFLNIKLRYSFQKNISSNLNVPKNQKNVLKKQLYIPYGINSEKNKSISNSISYTYQLKNNGMLGFVFSSSYLHRTGINDFNFEDIINKERNEVNITAMVFYSF